MSLVSLLPSYDEIKEVLLLFSDKIVRIDKPIIREYVVPTAELLRRIREKIIVKPQLYERVFEVFSEADNISEAVQAAAKILKMRSSVRPINHKKIENRVDILSINNLVRKKPTINIEEYYVGPYKIAIRENDENVFEYEYHVKIRSPDYLLYSLARTIAKLMVRYDYVFFSQRIVNMSLDEIIKHRSRLAQRVASLSVLEPYLAVYREVFIKELTDYSVYLSLNIAKIMPFLLDTKVQEFFCDSPGARVYLDHEIYGRCVSNITLRTGDFEAILRHLEADMGIPADEEHTSIKIDYNTELFSARVSIDKSPLAVNGYVLDVRKHSKARFTLLDLIRREFLDAEIAAFLVVSVVARANILIAGEPGSGKTTLLNALDMLLPRFVRRVYIEDAIESKDQLREGVHQVRLRVKPVELSEVLGAGRSTKAIEVIKALHRKPDYLILGELQTREHFIAAFHAMSSGLRCMATCHSRGPQELILRLTKVYDIPTDLINLLDLIIFTARNIYKNDFKYIYRIVEIESGNVVNIYEYNLGILGQSSRIPLLLEELGLSYDELYGAVLDRLVRGHLGREALECMLRRCLK